MKKKLKTDYKSDPDSKKYPGKMDVKIVVDTSMYEDWLAGLTEQERTDYWNKQVKKGESSF
jgi:hypothetical protein